MVIDSVLTLWGATYSKGKGSDPGILGTKPGSLGGMIVFFNESSHMGAHTLGSHLLWTEPNTKWFWFWTTGELVLGASLGCLTDQIGGPILVQIGRELKTTSKFPNSFPYFDSDVDLGMEPVDLSGGTMWSNGWSYFT